MSETELELVSFARANRFPITLLTAAFVLMLSVIGLQNAPFWDDSLRRLTGGTFWGSWDGRWGSEWVGRALNAGRPLVDLGLTSFVISGLVMSLASVIVVWVLVGRRANWLTWVLALAFGLNPWILNALAFRFDGPFMAISVLLAASSMFFYRCKPLWFFAQAMVLTLLTANFFQSAIGLILTLLMTRSLIDWVNRKGSNQNLVYRLVSGFAGVALGLVAYFGQTQLFGTGRSGWFNLGNPFGAFGNNLFHFLRVFVLDNAVSWLVATALVCFLGIWALLREAKRPLWQVLVALPGYFGLSILASGGVLLFATAEHIAVQARFRFPLAMGIGFLAIIASSAPSQAESFSPIVRISFVVSDSLGLDRPRVFHPRLVRILPKVILAIFAYLWLMPVFLFANVLGEQHKSLQFQTSLIFSDVYRLYRTGDVILYDPIIFTNPLVAVRTGIRFPIFNNPSYLGYLNHWSDNVRDQISEMVGLPQGVIEATDARPLQCVLPTDSSYLESVTGPRWVVWRQDAETICVTFPRLAKVVVNTPEFQAFTLNLNTFPFPLGDIPFAAVQNFDGFDPDSLEVAIWSLHNPSNIQRIKSDSVINGEATFKVYAPPGGWVVDAPPDGTDLVGSEKALVAHFFLNDEFLFQQIWLLG